jgi:histidyl-tRNA synthetase
VGETTDIVQKEMYTFNDKGGRSITLKPESTAGVARAYIESPLHAGVQPVKLFYIAPHFRYENPQLGRLRQHHQFGAEVYGSYSPAAEAEVMSLAYELLNRLGIKNTLLHINSLGGNECRARYNIVLKDFIGANLNKLCKTCAERFEKNPLRVLDCKEEQCQETLKNAPSTLSTLGEECRKHFDELQQALTRLGIPYVVDDRIVRGLDYYTRTVFEFISSDLGSPITVVGGGRYDNLIEECGGNPTGAVGFGSGIERLMLTLEAQGVKLYTEKHIDIYIGSIGTDGFAKAQTLAYGLRKRGVRAEADVVGRSVKAQMKYADKINALYSLIIGGDELAQNMAQLRDMKTGDKQEVILEENDLWAKLCKE